MNDTTVTDVGGKWFERLPPLRLARCCTIFTAATFAFFVLVAAIACWLHGQAALPAALVAVGTCWLSSLLALVGTAWYGRSGINGPLYTMAFGMVFNGAVPFVVGLVLNRAGGALSEAGVFGLMMIFIQFALVVETLLALCLLKSAR